MKVEPVNLSYGSVLIVDGRVYVDCRPLEDLAVYANVDDDTENKLYCLVNATRTGHCHVFEVYDKYNLCAKICNIYESEPEKPFVTYECYLQIQGTEGSGKFVEVFESPDFARTVEHFSDMVYQTNRFADGVYEAFFDKNFFDPKGRLVTSLVIKRITIDRSNKDE